MRSHREERSRAKRGYGRDEKGKMGAGKLRHREQDEEEGRGRGGRGTGQRSRRRMTRRSLKGRTRCGEEEDTIEAVNGEGRNE